MDEVVYQTNLADTSAIDPAKIISKRVSRHAAMSPLSLAKGAVGLRLIQVLQCYANCVPKMATDVSYMPCALAVFCLVDV